MTTTNPPSLAAMKAADRVYYAANPSIIGHAIDIQTACDQYAERKVMGMREAAIASIDALDYPARMLEDHLDGQGCTAIREAQAKLRQALSSPPPRRGGELQRFVRHRFGSPTSWAGWSGSGQCPRMCRALGA